MGFSRGEGEKDEGKGGPEGREVGRERILTGVGGEGGRKVGGRVEEGEVLWGEVNGEG